MIFRPTNVYPNNNAVDLRTATVPNFSYIFNGDDLILHNKEYYNANTGELVGMSYATVSNVYNGEEFSISISPLLKENGGKLENGFNYKYTIGLFQTDYNIFILQGTVRQITEVTLTDLQIPISYGLTNIRSPYRYTINGIENTLVGGMYLQVTNPNGETERRLITNCPNIKYGVEDEYGNADYRTYVEIESAFSVKPTSGTTYRIYSNYIKSPEYFFKGRKTPNVTLTASKNTTTGLLDCEAVYSQEQGVGVKCYQWKLYNVNSTLIEESDTIYSGRLQYSFMSEIMSGQQYILKCCIKTQDDMYVETDLTKTFTDVVGTYLTNVTMVQNNNCVDISWDYDSDVVRHVEVYRQEQSDGNNPKILLYGYTDRIIDSTVGTDKTYIYYLVPVLKNGSIAVPYVTEPIKVSFDDWYISYLTKRDFKYYNNQSYDILNTSYSRDTWRFELDINSNDIVQNLGISVHTGNNAKPKITSSDTNYISFTLTSKLSNLDCPVYEFVDNITKVERWREFISQKGAFLVQSPKGDVWVMGVSDNPTTNYEYSSFGLTTMISTTFTQIDDINNITVFKQS